MESTASGRTETCVSPMARTEVMPVPGRTYESMLGMASPRAMATGVKGPFTRWYPSGGLQAHGAYDDDGSSSQPDGLWAFWYESGARKMIGRYRRGAPVGCFAVWDEQGTLATAMADGEQIREAPCAPPIDDESITAIEKRSNSRLDVPTWGDVTLRLAPQAGDFGASNPTQDTADPSARFAAQVAVRKHVGGVRVGPQLGVRFSDTSGVRAYTLGAAGAYRLPLPPGRFDLEAGASLSVEYLAIRARRADRGLADVGLWSPLLGAQLTGTFALSPSLSLVAGLRADGWLSRDSEQEVRYCAPFCGPVVEETWQVGGLSYGVDVGVRLRIR